MKRIRQAGILLAFAVNMIFCQTMAAGGMENPAQASAGLGQSANDMTARNVEFERQGAALIEDLKSGILSGGYIKTGVSFDSAEAAHTFGKYFYRYIYLGREPVTLHSANTGGKYYILLSCADPERAAQQHGQVRDRLAQIVEAGQGMGDQEKAEFFYDWIYNNVTYDRTLQNKTIYDAVMEGSAVCWGYVSAYLSLCRTAGLVCEPVYRADHAWNRVWLDGGWKYCDITWDKCLGSSTWKFLTQDEMDADPMHNTL